MNAHQAAQIAAQNFYIISTLVTLAVTFAITLFVSGSK